MRTLFVCLLLVVIGCGDDDSPGPHDAGAAGSSGTRSAGKGGSGGNRAAGSGGSGTSGMSGGSGMGGSGTGGTGGGAAMGLIKLVPNIIAGKQTGSGSGNVGSQQNALRIGTVSATTLLSLKYYVTSIQLCEDAELMGSGFSNTAGCIQLYHNMTPNSPSYDDYTVMEAMADTTPGRYIDLMSAEGQAALRKPVMLQVPIAAGPVLDSLDAADGGVGEDGGVSEPAPRQAGVYRYGFINFYRPIKVRAEFPIIGETSDHYFRTKAVTSIHEVPSPTPGGIGNERVEIGDTLNGATEETTYMLSNGGALFVFQKPFAITQADIDANKEINIDLVFNPENFGQAYETSSCAADLRSVVCDPTNNVAIDMPFVRMSPVPRKSGEKTRKETYLVDSEGNTKVRIELYYNDADDEAGIQGVDTAIVYPAGVTHSMPTFGNIASNFVSQSGSVKTNDASVRLMDYRRLVNVDGLRRRQAGTVTIYCLYGGGGCSTATRAYSYVGDTVVSGE